MERITFTPRVPLARKRIIPIRALLDYQTLQQRLLLTSACLWRCSCPSGWQELRDGRSAQFSVSAMPPRLF